MAYKIRNPGKPGDRRDVPRVVDPYRQVGLSGGILSAVAGDGAGFGNFQRPSEVGSLVRTLFSRFLWVGLRHD